MNTDEHGWPQCGFPPALGESRGGDGRNSLTSPVGTPAFEGSSNVRALCAGERASETFEFHDEAPVDEQVGTVFRRRSRRSSEHRRLSAARPLSRCFEARTRASFHRPFRESRFPVQWRPGRRRRSPFWIRPHRPCVHPCSSVFIRVRLWVASLFNAHLRPVADTLAQQPRRAEYEDENEHDEGVDVLVVGTEQARLRTARTPRRTRAGTGPGSTFVKSPRSPRPATR